MPRVEYHDHTSTTIHVRFPVVKAGDPALEGAAIVIWTTTPWTMPGNRAVAYGDEIDYVVVESTEVAENSLAKVGEKLVVARRPARRICKAQTPDRGPRGTRQPQGRADLAGTVCAHPLRGQGYDYDVPALSADFVTDDAGTGFVHIAPGHGADDFVLGKRARIWRCRRPSASDGVFYDHVPIFAGKMHVLEDGKHGDVAAVIDAITAAWWRAGKDQALTIRIPGAPRRR
ncbi:MAG: hypothetical protein ACMVO3_02720 [Thalassobaculum sp.]